MLMVPERPEAIVFSDIATSASVPMCSVIPSWALTYLRGPQYKIKSKTKDSKVRQELV